MQPISECAPAPERRKLLICRALAPRIEPFVGPDVETAVLDIALHVSPQRLRQELQHAVESLEEPGCVILLGYGLCGRAAEGVVSRRSTLVLPRVDDCVGALLGSRLRHQTLMREEPGYYFLEPSWVDTEANIFVQLEQSLDRLPPGRRDQIARLTLKHYRAVALLLDEAPDPEAARHCKGYARRHGLRYVELGTDAGLLARLAQGPWTEDEFVICPPGTPIPFF